MISALASRTCGLAMRRGQLLLERARERVQLVGPVERQQRDRAVALAQHQRHVTSPLAVSPRSAATAVSAMRS